METLTGIQLAMASFSANVTNFHIRIRAIRSLLTLQRIVLNRLFRKYLQEYAYCLQRRSHIGLISNANVYVSLSVFAAATSDGCLENPVCHTDLADSCDPASHLAVSLPFILDTGGKNW